MSKNIVKSCLAAVLMSCAGLAAAADFTEVLHGEHRSEAAMARDDARNPAETLAFFGLQPTDTVVELSLIHI